MLLLLVHQRPAHGYTLLEGLREFGLGSLDPSAAYRTLREMEDMGWVTSDWDAQQSMGPPRRVYRITEEGDRVLALWMNDLAETCAMLERLLGAYREHMASCEGEHYPRSRGGEAKERDEHA